MTTDHSHDHDQHQDHGHDRRDRMRRNGRRDARTCTPDPSDIPAGEPGALPGPGTGTDAYDDEAAERLARRLRESRREHGPERANADWMDGPLDAWLARLERRGAGPDRDTMAALAVGMREVLSIRDALILSMLFDDDECGRDVLMDILSRPRTKEVSSTVRDLLSAAFEDERGPNVERCRAGVGMLAAMAGLMPRAFCAQPYAAIAYVLWWLGDAGASAYALRSLALDDGCSLAAIVLGAASRGACPACARR
ncbi:DUF4192 domain-containing protein [Bifidobacterium saguinibicoloris]|uniref:DUF4192 domain-containing protein n=1 Tax=Bifidobacterium saguinibicoloris TaxID=2834433 RepID=UPI001F1EEA7A|nr:DUF4192 domain-containing protein [Bifidobacterium saguinibicoloris]